MKKTLSLIVFVFFLINVYSCFAQTSISAKDMKPFKGNWYGTLTYLDYSSGKPYTMPADLIVKQVGTTNQFMFSHIYPNEPQANSIDTLIISADGKMINEEIVQSIRKLENGNTEIQTEYSSIDGNDNKSALIRHTYTVGKKVFMGKKEVQFVGERHWIKRHEFSYERTKKDAK